MTNLLSRPTLSGNSRVSPLYQIMGSGVTTPILLLGHADAEVYQPYQVVNMQETINMLGANMLSPLVRALLECYNSGCKDIWVYPVAPMSEYVSLPASRYEETGSPAQTFYERYYDRLEVAYELLKAYDFYQIVVPLEAPFYDAGDVDFLTQLADFCSESFDISGSVAMGVLGTRVPRIGGPALESSTNYDEANVTEMINDTRIAQLGERGKFITIVAGEGTFMHPQASGVYSRSFDAAIASLIATSPLDRSIAGLKLKGVATVSHQLFTESQVELLAQAKINTIYKTAQGRRGVPYEIKLLTDNTAGLYGTQYWSISQMRTIAYIANRIRDYGYSLIGEKDADLFKSAVKSFLDYLKKNQSIVNYSLKITFEDNTKAIVELGVTPIFGIKNILFTVEVGPGA